MGSSSPGCLWSHRALTPRYLSNTLPDETGHDRPLQVSKHWHHARLACSQTHVLTLAVVRLALRSDLAVNSPALSTDLAGKGLRPWTVTGRASQLRHKQAVAHSVAGSGTLTPRAA